MKHIKAVRQKTAADQTGIDTGQLARMIKAGRVEVWRTADDLALIPLEEVERLKRESRRPGRPKAE